MGWLEDLGNAVASGVAVVADTVETVVETVTDTTENVVDAGTDAMGDSVTSMAAPLLEWHRQRGDRRRSISTGSGRPGHA
jgi:hypothetical protein